ncbi:hypothetical protein TNCT_211151 [Trichonephila clavata]|uniref:Uncharacterized protein n=1 Tax=Trichonephila clavata TaxID=2740835 RepID=A0A8X6HWA3_TRICU|nr:hypothetical protein TNCT_211151 [Trichonephila clavata]
MKQWQLEYFDHLNINDFVNYPHRALGLLWHRQNDYISLRLNGLSLLDFLQNRKNTKRFLLMAAASKSRELPLKSLTFLRLELMGALFAARLAKEVSRVLIEKISTTNYFWTDLTIALSWIQCSSNRWEVFITKPCKGDMIFNTQGFVASLSWKR